MGKYKRWGCSQNGKRKPVLSSNEDQWECPQTGMLQLAPTLSLALGMGCLSPWRHCHSYLWTPALSCCFCSYNRIPPLLYVTSSRLHIHVRYIQLAEPASQVWTIRTISCHIGSKSNELSSLVFYSRRWTVLPTKTHVHGISKRKKQSQTLHKGEKDKCLLCKIPLLFLFWPMYYMSVFFTNTFYGAGLEIVYFLVLNMLTCRLNFRCALKSYKAE